MPPANTTTTLYDTDDYYAGTDGARLAPVFEPVIAWLDGLRARSLLRQLRPPANRPPRVLDVGAGTGGVLVRLRERGVEVHGTTASRTARDAAERRHGLALEVATDIPAARHGLHIERATGFSLKFTYVFLWSVLLGYLFGAAYDFDSVFDVLKRPLASLRRRPLHTLNAMAAVVYLAPAIIPLAAWGGLTGRGEVLRAVITRGAPTP